MTVEPRIALRLQFLARVVRKECQHLATTDQRLFAGMFTLAQAAQLEADHDLAERVEAFVGRFGRLQDTVGDKLLPLLLTALGEKTSAAIDNLDRAERLELVISPSNSAFRLSAHFTKRWTLSNSACGLDSYARLTAPAN